MSHLFGGPSIPAPAPAPAAPTPTDPSTQLAAQQLAFSQAQAAGRASTVMTSGMGDTTPAPAIKKVLLGS